MKELAVFTQAGKSQLDSALTTEYRAKGKYLCCYTRVTHFTIYT